jgi:hypothetical protein
MQGVGEARQIAGKAQLVVVRGMRRLAVSTLVQRQDPESVG